MHVATNSNKQNSRNIRNNKHLARRIARTSSFTTRGYFPSRKNSARLYFESYLELWQLIEAEYAADIHYINTQPHTIKYINSKGNLAQYTSDVMFKLANGTYQFREVKPEIFCDEAKFKRIKEVYKDVGPEFDVFTDKTYSQTRQDNLAQLFHFSSQYFDVDERLFAALNVLPEQCAIAEASALLRQYKQWPAATFYCLFLQYYLCDLELPLSPNTVITRNIF
jgi:hypothetical protein